MALRYYEAVQNVKNLIHLFLRAQAFKQRNSSSSCESSEINVGNDLERSVQ